MSQLVPANLVCAPSARAVNMVIKPAPTMPRCVLHACRDGSIRRAAATHPPPARRAVKVDTRPRTKTQPPASRAPQESTAIRRRSNKSYMRASIAELADSARPRAPASPVNAPIALLANTGKKPARRKQTSANPVQRVSSASLQEGPARQQDAKSARHPATKISQVKPAASQRVVQPVSGGRGRRTAPIALPVPISPREV